MKKNSITLTGLALSALFVLGACSKVVSTTPADSSTSATYPTVIDTTDTGADTDDTKPDTSSADGASGGNDSTGATNSSASGKKPVEGGYIDSVTRDSQEDISGAIPYTACMETPAETGQWIETKKRDYSSDEKEYHTCYFRITECSSDQEEIASLIAQYMENSSFLSIPETPENEAVEYRLVRYDYYYPEDFCAPGKTISNKDCFNFGIGKTEEGGWEAGGQRYIFVASDVELGQTRDAVYAGDTYHGVILYTMLKEYTGDYYFREEATPEEDVHDSFLIAYPG